jgi:hypothetical protein
MNPTQFFEFVMNWINQKIIKFNRVPLGQNHDRPSRTARARPAATRARPGLAPVGAAHTAQPGRPAQCAAHGASGARRRNARRRRCTAPACGKRPKNGGSSVRGRRTAARRRRRGFGWDGGAVGEAVGTTVTRVRRGAVE